MWREGSLPALLVKVRVQIGVATMKNSIESSSKNYKYNYSMIQQFDF